MRFKATVTWHIQLSFAEQFFCRLPMLDQLVACTSLGTDVCLDFGFFYCSVFGETNQPNNSAFYREFCSLLDIKTRIR